MKKREIEEWKKSIREEMPCMSMLCQSQGGCIFGTPNDHDGKLEERLDKVFK